MTNENLPSDNEQQRPHKPADDKELVYYEGSPMLRADMGFVVLWAAVAAVLVVIPILFRIYKPGTLPTWVTIVAIALAILCLVIPVLIIRARRYRISNYRIDYERGLLSKRIDTLELWHVDDISFKQSLLDRILNVGTIIVMSHDDTTPKLELGGIPNPRAVFESLKQRIIAVKRQRGVIKMDM
jgi:membrane protein YdbS with pleckstrin-like domain